MAEHSPENSVGDPSETGSGTQVVVIVAKRAVRRLRALPDVGHGEAVRARGEGRNVPDVGHRRVGRPGGLCLKQAHESRHVLNGDVDCATFPVSSRFRASTPHTMTPPSEFANPERALA